MTQTPLRRILNKSIILISSLSFLLLPDTDFSSTAMGPSMWPVNNSQEF